MTPADDAQRDTAKHGRRHDEAMAGEDRSFTTGAPVEARSRDERKKETLENDIADPAARPGSSSTATMSSDEADLRRRLADVLSDAPFPIDRNGLIRHVGEADERSGLVARLRALPADQDYGDVQAVVTAMSGVSSADR